MWVRLHARQALVFGLFASLALLVILSFPLIAVMSIPEISTGATIGVYTAGLIVDAIAGSFAVVLAMRFSSRAARGELFAIPLVTPIVDRVFRLPRP